MALRLCLILIHLLAISIGANALGAHVGVCRLLSYIVLVWWSLQRSGISTLLWCTLIISIGSLLVRVARTRFALLSLAILLALLILLRWGQSH